MRALILAAILWAAQAAAVRAEQPAFHAESAPGLCKDAPGVDRVAVHRQFEKDIAAFLHQSLRGAASRLP
ncbi:MAG TPA: hypothetical protein VNT30_07725 [Stellaceae bacterium]|nr:hypothetical protein [Stellaceae bacterium]